MELVPGFGIKGDLHALPGSSRQVLLIDVETLREFGLPPGLVRENITTLGLPITFLARGSRLAIGTTRLTITSPCQPCSRMDEIREGLRQDLAGRRGMLARVTEGGTVHLGDSIDLLKT